MASTFNLVGRALGAVSSFVSQFRAVAGFNKAVYSLLRYGVQTKVEIGENAETVKLINWDVPEANDFAIAEEVTLNDNHKRRPDLVLYSEGVDDLAENRTGRLSREIGVGVLPGCGGAETGKAQRSESGDYQGA